MLSWVRGRSLSSRWVNKVKVGSPMIEGVAESGREDAAHGIDRLRMNISSMPLATSSSMAGGDTGPSLGHLTLCLKGHTVSRGMGVMAQRLGRHMKPQTLAQKHKDEHRYRHRHGIKHKKGTGAEVQAWTATGRSTNTATSRPIQPHAQL